MDLYLSNITGAAGGRMAGGKEGAALVLLRADLGRVWIKRGLEGWRPRYLMVGWPGHCNRWIQRAREKDVPQKIRNSHAGDRPASESGAFPVQECEHLRAIRDRRGKKAVAPLDCRVRRR